MGSLLPRLPVRPRKACFRMTRRSKWVKVPGHTAIDQGTARDRDGIPQIGGGFGYTFCECGLRSPKLDCNYARASWHRDHKREVYSRLHNIVDAMADDSKGATSGTATR
jgi:hypothetical protein